MLELRPEGLYCAAGDFFVDPWEPVARALITHAHSDHACPGSQAYLTAAPGGDLLRERVVGPVQTADYGQHLTLGDTVVSFHPAGHILGSAQIRIERSGEVWVVSGDYKLSTDSTCAPFEPVRCHTFVSESTFGLPIFRWSPQSDTIAEIHEWWRANRAGGKTSVLFAYPLGKAQRVLAALDTSIGPYWAHDSVERYSRAYRAQGIAIPPQGQRDGASLVVAHPGYEHRGTRVSTAMVSGWMRIRGPRRRQALDRGFVLSDHADWPDLLRAIDASNAPSVWVTHGFRAPLVRWLHEHGREAVAVEARYPEPEA